MGENNEGNQERYTLTQEHVDAIKRRLDELVGKQFKPDDNIFEGGETDWKIGGYYNTN